MRKVNLTQEGIIEAAECLKALAHPVRLKIICLLAEEELAVGEIALKCDVAPNVASTHLKLLERCKFLRGSRNGQSVSYKIVERHLFDLLRCMEKRFA